MVITARCIDEVSKHSRSDVDGGFAFLQKCLVQIALKYLTSTPLHLTVHMKFKGYFTGIIDLLLYDISPVPITCTFHNISITNGARSLNLAYDFGAVIYLLDQTVRPGAAPINCDANELAVNLAGAIDEMSYEEEEDGWPPGQIFLCDISRLVLSPKELAACENANDAATLKVFNLCEIGHLRQSMTKSQRWDLFVSRVKLVDPGFKSSEADIAASVKRRSVL